MAKKDYKYIAFGKLLRNEIREKFIKIKACAELIHIPTSDLYDYESGRIFPPIDKFLVLCKSLNRTPSYMLAPYLDLSPKDKELLHFFNLMREFYDDPDTKILVQTMCRGLEILLMEKRGAKDMNITELLNNIKNKLMK